MQYTLSHIRSRRVLRKRGEKQNRLYFAARWLDEQCYMVRIEFARVRRVHVGHGVR